MTSASSISSVYGESVPTGKLLQGDDSIKEVTGSEGTSTREEVRRSCVDGNSGLSLGGSSCQPPSIKLTGRLLKAESIVPGSDVRNGSLLLAMEVSLSSL